MKQLKFSHTLIPLVLSGEKTTTWRVDDDKDLSEGDEIELCRANGTVFATARIEATRETMFGKLDEWDWAGHEKFPNEKAMINMYSAFYGKEITPETPVKVVKFSLEKKSGPTGI